MRQPARLNAKAGGRYRPPAQPHPPALSSPTRIPWPLRSEGGRPRARAPAPWWLSGRGGAPPARRRRGRGAACCAARTGATLRAPPWALLAAAACPPGSPAPAASTGEGGRDATPSATQAVHRVSSSSSSARSGSSHTQLRQGGVGHSHAPVTARRPAVPQPSPVLRPAAAAAAAAAGTGGGAAAGVVGAAPGGLMGGGSPCCWLLCRRSDWQAHPTACASGGGWRVCGGAGERCVLFACGNPAPTAACPPAAQPSRVS